MSAPDATDPLVGHNGTDIFRDTYPAKTIILAVLASHFSGASIYHALLLFLGHVKITWQ